jgi:hypothetical protein
MARGTLNNAEPDGDFALGMGLAIGMFIALFAVGIALFVIEQNKAPPGRTSTAVSAPTQVPAAASSTREAE